MFVIKEKDENYFQSMIGIGPMFGGTKKEAYLFDDKIQATKMLSSHIGFARAWIEEIKSGGKIKTMKIDDKEPKKKEIHVNTIKSVFRQSLLERMGKMNDACQGKNEKAFMKYAREHRELFTDAVAFEQALYFTGLQKIKPVPGNDSLSALS